MSEKKGNKLRYYWNLIRGKTDALNPAKLDFRHIWAVIQSWVRSILPTPIHIKEQIEWRITQIKSKSPQCWEKGHCIQCGCEMEGKVKADMGCENHPFCYPEMMGKKEWNNFKNQNNVESSRK